MLGDVFRDQEKIVYEYDPACEWLHGATLCRTIEMCNEPYPRRIAAEGDAPPADCGGAEDYSYAMRVRKSESPGI